MRPFIQNERMPDRWSNSRIVLVHKKRKKTIFETTFKLLTKIISRITKMLIKPLL